MINFMLNDLRRPASVGLDTSLHFRGLIPNLDGFIAFALVWAAEKRQTAFLSVVRAIIFDNLWIKHHRVCMRSPTLVEKCDYALLHTDHIRCHANTIILVRH